MPVPVPLALWLAVLVPDAVTVPLIVTVGVCVIVFVAVPDAVCVDVPAGVGLRQGWLPVSVEHDEVSIRARLVQPSRSSPVCVMVLDGVCV